MEFHHDNNPSPDQPSFFGKTTLWTVAFSTIGGVYKAHATPHVLLDSLTIDGTLAVVSYAFVSAVVGYCTKLALDFLFKKFKK